MTKLSQSEKDTLKFIKSQGGSIGTFGFSSMSQTRKNIFSLLEKKKIELDEVSLVATIKSRRK